MRAAPVVRVVIGAVVGAVVGAGLLLPMPPARAQVTTNDGALDSLSAPRPRPAAPPAQRPARPSQRPAPAPQAAAPAKPATPAKPARPEIPVSPPAILALPPPVAVPLAHPPPPPTVPLADDAPGAAQPIRNGMRVTFGADRADFSPATAAALDRFAQTLAGPNTASITIFAYAAGSPDDPSTPRRLSLQRAMAARAVLLKAGIVSPRIFPRAIGPAAGEQPDRVDVVTGSVAPPAGLAAGTAG